MKHWLGGAAAVVIVAALVLGGAYWQFESLFNPSAPSAPPTVNATPLEAQRADVDQFERLISLDRSYSDEARTDARVRVAALRASDEVVPPARLRMALSAVVALADNAHSQLFSAPGGRANLIPLRVHGFSDGVYVLRADSADAGLLGAQLTHIDGRPVANVIAALAPFRGGTAAWRRNWAYTVLSSPEVLYGAGVGRDPARTTWRFLVAGESVEQTFEAKTPDDNEPLPGTSRWLSPEPVEGQPQDWRAFAPAGQPSLAMANFGEPFRRAWIDDSCVLFLQFKTNQDEDGHSITEFTRETRAAIRSREPCSVILDMRFNGGGDYTTTAGFMRDLPALIAPSGRVYILTGVDTFSAGITSTALVEQAAPERVIILGGAVGDRLSFFSEGGDGCLPHARLCVSFARGKHDYGEPCTDWRTCYWINYAFPVQVRSLAPDETIGLSFVEYAHGRDPAFERAMALARGN
jgi:hypothetical protein